MEDTDRVYLAVQWGAILDRCLSIADRLPIGRDAEDALAKLQRELRELAACEPDTLAAWLEAGDCMYYAVKAARGDDIGWVDAIRTISTVCADAGIHVFDAIVVLEAKYDERLRTRKKDAVQEQHAALTALRMGIFHQAGIRVKGNVCTPKAKSW